jgi:dienelactone hydrolase
VGDGECCDDHNCLCHGDAPKELTSAKGPYGTESYNLAGAGCVYYPKDAKPPFAAVAVSDGFGGAGGCGRTQTDQWGPLYASWGIVAMIINTGSGDQPNVRGQKLLTGIKAFKAEHAKSGSPLEGKLSGRYGTSGFSMGGGGTTYASRDDKTLLSSVAIMPWGPVNSGITVPTLVICGSSDTIAPCNSHGIPAYKGIAETVPKMHVQITSSHAGQPGSGMGKSGQYGLAFQKVFLEGDQRWRPLLVGATSVATTIK